MTTTPTIKKIIPTEEQSKAIQYCIDYIEGKIGDNGKGYIFISGQAGVGKSEIQKFILNNYESDEFKLVAYTAKAARVMSEKSGYESSTIHRLMYTPVTDSKGEIIDWIYDRDTLRKNKKLKFVLIDECSMMTEYQLNDLISSGKKIIVFGDYYQLPPINAPQIFTKENADIILSKIHRQAEGNPLIQHLVNLRNKIDVPYGNFGGKLIKVPNVVEYFNNDTKKFLDYDQIICGTNNTRKMLNQMIRQIKGIKSDLPTVGEKLICLKNNNKVGVVNGEQFIVKQAPKFYNKKMGLARIYTDINEERNIENHNKKDKGFVFITDNFDNIIRERISRYVLPKTVKTLPNGGLIQEPHYVEADFAYSISCHKSQGSEWKNVLIVDESDMFGEFKYRWLYTAVSRGKESATIIKL